MSPEEEEARERLLFHLENQSGFWFALVVGDDARPRARLCEAAEAWCKGNGRPFTLHQPEPTRLVQLAVSLAQGESTGIHWIRADGVKGLIEEWNAGAAQMLMAMNERREAYRKRFDGGIVVEGRSPLKRILREMAPDLFSIRAFIAEPGEEPEARPSEFPEWRRPLSQASLVSGDHVDPDLALTRLARLTALEGLATTKSWIEAEARATTSLFNAGRHVEAASHAHELLSRIEQDADDALKEHPHPGVWAYEVLAGIAIIKNNDLHEALRLLDQALNILSRPARDPTEKLMYALAGITLRKLRAHILLGTGDLDAAREALERYVRAFPPSGAGLLPETQLDLVDSHIHLARVLAKQDKFDEAEDVLQKSVQIAKQCAAQSSEDDRWQLEVLRSITALGHTQLMKRDIGAALKTLIPAAALAERLETHGSIEEPWRGVLDDFYFAIGFILSFELSYSKPLDHIREQALAGIRRQLELAPDDDSGWMLASFYLHRVTLLEKEDVAGAKDAAQQALDLVAKLPVRNEEDASLKSKIEALRSFLRKPRKTRRSTKH